jgi:hypothetical protein
MAAMEVIFGCFRCESEGAADRRERRVEPIALTFRC